MLKQRLIGVVTVRDGQAVQSFGFRRWLPIGTPEAVVANLDRWGADEIILLCTNRSGTRKGEGLGPDFALLERIGKLGLATPLVYGGGIRHAADAVQVVKSAADRVVVDSLLHDDFDAVMSISETLGAQALVAALPLRVDRRRLAWLNHRTGDEGRLPRGVLSLLSERIASEALLIDWQHEGTPGTFDERIAQRFSAEGLPYVAFGGIGDAAQLGRVLALPHAVGVALGNPLAWRENAIQEYRRALGSSAVRDPAFAGKPHV